MQASRERTLCVKQFSKILDSEILARRARLTRISKEAQAIVATCSMEEIICTVAATIVD